MNSADSLADLLAYALRDFDKPYPVPNRASRRMNGHPGRNRRGYYSPRKSPGPLFRELTLRSRVAELARIRNANEGLYR